MLWELKNRDNSEILEFLRDRAVNDPFEYQEKKRYNPRHSALNALVNLDPLSAETLNLLRDRALNDPDEQLRKWAQKQLKKMEASSNG